MESSNSFFEFAQEYLRNHSGIGEDFEISPELLDEFHTCLDKRRIQPSLSEWSSTVGFIRNRIKQEIFNLAIGVEKGDEVATRRDPVVRAALRTLAEPLQVPARP